MTRQNNPEIPSWLNSNQLRIADVTDTKSLLNATKDIDVVIHLAAINEIESAANPEKATREPQIFNLGSETNETIATFAKRIQERAKALLQKETELKPNTGTPEIGFSLDSTQLKSTRFTLRNNITEEIDNMLLYCKRGLENDTI